MGSQAGRQAGSALLCVRSMCKHQFRDRQAHHSHSGINKLAVCRSQLDQGTQGQHMDALHFALTAEQTAPGEKIFSLEDIQSRVYTTGGRTSGKTLRVYLKNVLTYTENLSSQQAV